MMKSDQRHRNSSTNVSVGVAKRATKVNSKSDSKLKLTEKPERQHTSRVKFKDNVGSNKVKGAKSVQFVRNTTVPANRTRSVVSFTPCLEEKQQSNEDKTSGNNSESEVCGVPNKLKLNAPELCTSLRFANKLLDQAIYASKCTLRSDSLEDTCSANAAKVKVLRKVNIPFEEQIYKDLVDLKVTDNDLFPDQERKFRTKQFVRNKEKEPDLSDFYKPSFNQEFVIKPEKLKVEPEKIVHYDGFSISDRSKHWESSS